MMAKPVVSVVIVSWQVRAHLRRCLLALPAAMQDVAYEVIVVDNASADGTVAMLRRDFNDVVVIANDENVLYTLAANQGLARARGDFALLLNPDVVPHPGSLARLVRYAQAHPQVGLLGPRILDAAGQDDWRTGRNYPTPWSEFMDWLGGERWFRFPPFLLKNRRLNYDRAVTSFVPLLSGACLLFSSDLPLHLRQLNPIFRMYGEDIDLCRRFDHAGIPKVLVADAVVTHLGGASSQQCTVRCAVLAVVAMNRYFRRWEGRYSAWLPRILLGLVALLKVIIFCTGSLFKPFLRQKCHIYRNTLRWAMIGEASLELAHLPAVM